VTQRSRLPRRAVLGALTLLLLVVAAGPAMAVGADGVSMQVDVPRDGDRRVPMLVDGSPATGELRIRNRNEEERTVSLFAVRANQQEPGGSVSLGAKGTAPWIGLDDRELTLAPGEMLTVPLELNPSGVPKDTDGRLPTAFVLEVARGETVVLQAVSLLSVTGAEAPGMSWIWVLIAALMLLAVGARAVVEWRRQSRTRRPAQLAVPVPA
jgi:hypothetical protein